MTLLKLVVDWRSVVTECSVGDGDNNECGGVILLFKGFWVGDVYFVVYNPGWILVFFKFIGEICVLKTSDTGACSGIWGPPSEDALSSAVVSAPSEVATDGGREDVAIRGEMVGVVSLCNNLAISNRAPFADKGVPFEKLSVFLCNKCTRSSAVFLM
jgi:hypothetical protein